MRNRIIFTSGPRHTPHVLISKTIIPFEHKDFCLTLLVLLGQNIHHLCLLFLTSLFKKQYKMATRIPWRGSQNRATAYTCQLYVISFSKSTSYTIPCTVNTSFGSTCVELRKSSNKIQVERKTSKFGSLSIVGNIILWRPSRGMRVKVDLANLKNQTDFFILVQVLFLR